MFYISFQFCFSDGFFHFPDPYIVIVTLQRCHFYFSEMNPPPPLYIVFFLSCCGTILSSFSCFSIVFHRYPSILTTTPSIPPLHASPPSLEGIHPSSFAILPPLSLYTSVAYTNIHISILSSSVSVNDNYCKILHPF